MEIVVLEILAFNLPSEKTTVKEKKNPPPPQNLFFPTENQIKIYFWHFCLQSTVN